ncbi:Hpt domain-containing protein [uncultured Roseovarius sp.]|uniref:Hpt domain-containing protein n=1 Tax=Roseovarius sp. TaxID=1486281 RepID=UPI0025CFA97A|nr:Hpt domain-containing protein [uncultured Roseovarius sp.]
MIDWDRVQDLSDEIGPDAFGEVVELFLEEVDVEIDKLRQITDRIALESQLHFLKGSALNLGFAAFAELCHRGEVAAVAGQQNTVDIAAILTCYDRSKSMFLSDLGRVIAA